MKDLQTKIQQCFHTRVQALEQSEGQSTDWDAALAVLRPAGKTVEGLQECLEVAEARQRAAVSQQLRCQLLEASQGMSASQDTSHLAAFCKAWRALEGTPSVSDTTSEEKKQLEVVGGIIISILASELAKPKEGWEASSWDQIGAWIEATCSFLQVRERAKMVKRELQEQGESQKERGHLRRSACRTRTKL